MGPKNTTLKANDAKRKTLFFKSLQWNSILLRTSALALFWWILNQEDHASWIIGGPFIVVAVAFSIVLAPRRALHLRPLQVVRFIPLFLWESLKGGVDVTRRVFLPTMPLHPIIIHYKVNLPVGLPRLLMLNVVSLLPGTLSADLHEDRLTLHILDKHTAFEADLQRVETCIARMVAPIPGENT